MAAILDFWLPLTYLLLTIISSVQHRGSVCTQKYGCSRWENMFDFYIALCEFSHSLESEKTGSSDLVSLAVRKHTHGGTYIHCEATSEKSEETVVQLYIWWGRIEAPWIRLYSHSSQNSQQILYIEIKFGAGNASNFQLNAGLFDSFPLSILLPIPLPPLFSSPLWSKNVFGDNTPPPRNISWFLNCCEF